MRADPRGVGVAMSTQGSRRWPPRRGSRWWEESDDVADPNGPLLGLVEPTLAEYHPASCPLADSKCPLQGENHRQQ